MALSVNTNIASLTAQRNLGKSQGSLNTAMQRLSSGLRINSAKDDAAGLAISNRMTSQIRGLNQAARNANDGISMAQTAEGALGESTNILQRIRELSIQSANDTNTSTDRASLQSEVSQLVSELDRIATSTSFNGKTLLDGTLSNASFHIGANANQSITMSIGSARAAALGALASGTSTVTQTITPTTTGAADTYTNPLVTFDGVGSTAFGVGTIAINGTDVDATAAGTETGQTNSSAYAKALAINASGIDGVTAVASNTQIFADLAGNFMEAVDMAANSATYTLTINGDSVYSASLADGDTISIDSIVTSINNNTADTGVVASKDASNDLVLSAADGRDITIKDSYAYNDTADTDAVDIFSTVFSAITTDAAVNDAEATALSSELVFQGKVALTSTSDITFDNAATLTSLGRAGDISIDLTNNVSTVDISTAAGANTAIGIVDAALSTIDSQRGTLGATQNRFESTISNLQNVAENLTGARSRILDADIAMETAAMTKANILQQAGVAILAQANQTPQLALSLLT